MISILTRLSGLSPSRRIRVLIHAHVQNQVDETLKRQKALRKKWLNKLRQIRSNPDVGGALKYIPNPELKGVVRRAHVGGPGGHRLLYLWLADDRIILPILLSAESRSGFKYEVEDLVEQSIAILEDYSEGKHELFSEWLDT